MKAHIVLDLEKFNSIAERCQEAVDSAEKHSLDHTIKVTHLDLVNEIKSIAIKLAEPEVKNTKPEAAEPINETIPEVEDEIAKKPKRSKKVVK